MKYFRRRNHYRWNGGCLDRLDAFELHSRLSFPMHTLNDILFRTSFSSVSQEFLLFLRPNLKRNNERLGQYA